jgi:hypothetical protein
MVNQQNGERDADSNTNSQAPAANFCQVSIFHLTNSNTPLLQTIILYLNSHSSSS